MAHMTRTPSRPLALRLASWLMAAVLASVASIIGVSPPATAAPSGGSGYVPRCYTLCLTYTNENFVHEVVAYTLHYGYQTPTPYYISIYNVATGELLAICGTSRPECRTRNVYGWDPSSCITWIAYIGGVSASMPPEPVLTTSNTVRHCFTAR